MKKILLIFSFIGLLFSGCKTNKTDSVSNSDSTSVSDANSLAVCIWDKTALKAEPTAQGKWIASISIGEKAEYLDETKEDNSGKKAVIYCKIKLQDGTEGWAQTDYVIINSKAATLLNNADVYSRPDLLTKTDKSFSKMDIVAIKSEQNNFIEIVGKRKDGKWIETGWIKPENATTKDVDIAVAKFASVAMVITDELKRKEEIKKIIENPDLAGSSFIEFLTDQYGSTSVEQVPVVDTVSTNNNIVQ